MDHGLHRIRHRGLSMHAGAAQELLLHVRELVAGGDYAAVAGVVDAVRAEVLLAEPELGYHAAYAWRRLGRTGEALELVTALDVPVRRKAEARLIRRRLNLEAMLRYDRGEMQQAEELWSRVVEAASSDRDYVLLAAAHNNLGVLMTLRDRLDDALATYTRALTAARQHGDARGAAQAHQNLAIAYREQLQPQRADAHFHEAMRQSREAGHEDVLGRAEEERALLLLEQGDVALARASALMALDRLRSIGDMAGAGEALRVLGIIALRSEDAMQAERCLTETLALARQVGNPLLDAETNEAFACLAEARGDAESAARYRSEAEDTFERISARPWGARIRRRTRQLTGVA